MNKSKIIAIIITIFVLFGFSVTNIVGKYDNNPFENPVRIAFISDNNYVLPLRTAIRSIIANKKPKTQIEINVIAVNITDSNINKIENERKKNVHINVIVISDGILKFKGGSVINPTVSRADIAKFYLSDILKDIDKIIYLDCDTLVLEDLSDLYNTKLGDNYAAVTDDWQTHYFVTDNKERFFNNGMMLLNLNKIRQDNIEAKLVDYKLNDKINRFVTQDAFNSAFYGKTIFVPLIYDTFAPEYDNDYVLVRIKEVLGIHYNPKLYPYKTKKDFQNAVVVIHYCGYFNVKPWWKIDFLKKSNRLWYKYVPVDLWTITLHSLLVNIINHVGVIIRR